MGGEGGGGYVGASGTDIYVGSGGGSGVCVCCVCVCVRVGGYLSGCGCVRVC